VVESLLEGPMTFTPFETDEGKRYTGRIATRALLEVPSGPQLGRPQGEHHVADGLDLRRLLRSDMLPVLEMSYVA
jgi:hypothetical protein